MPSQPTTPLDRVQIRVISLRSRKDRRQQVEDNLAGLPITWSFFDALMAGDPSPYRVEPLRQLETFGRTLTSSEVGCALSHLHLLTEFTAHRSSEWLLVLEDDVWLDPQFDLIALTELCESLSLGYVRLYAKYWVGAKRLGLWKTRNFLRFRTDPYGAQAYLINNKSARIFLGSVSTIDMPIDDEIGRFWNNGLLPYSIFPFPVIERSSPSSIDADRSGLRKQNSPQAVVFRLKSKLIKLVSNAALSLGDGVLKKSFRRAHSN